MKNKKAFAFSLVTLLAITIIPLATAHAKDLGAYLSQEQLTSMPKLMERFQHASKEDHNKANALLAMADKYRADRRWGAASKAYGESAIVRPSANALAGLSVATANISRKRNTCSEEIPVKILDASVAISYMQTAVKFGGKTGAGYDALFIYQIDLLSSLQKIITRYHACNAAKQLSPP